VTKLLGLGDSSLLERCAVIGAFSGGVIGGIVGLVIGLTVHWQTAWFATFEAGIPAGVVSGLLGAIAPTRGPVHLLSVAPTKCDVKPVTPRRHNTGAVSLGAISRQPGERTGQVLTLAGESFVAELGECSFALVELV
jgi:hypothetical protein